MDERTWEDQQDSLDYKQWKAEQDLERANMESEGDKLSSLRAERNDYFLRVQELEAENNILRSLLEEVRRPNWSEAPQWAEWWAMDANGDGYWYEAEPELGGLIWKQKWDTRNEPDEARENDIWRMTLQARPID